MPFTPVQFVVGRPYLFHLTDRRHLGHLRQTRTLSPAGDLLARAGQPQWTRQKRHHHVEIDVGGQTIKVRDQSPLHEGNMELDGGWTFADFIAQLNRRVFFWPGRRDGLPISYGMRHFERYVGEQPIILRIPTGSLFAANPGVVAEFCRYNSGSPRWTRGRASPRGAQTFVPGVAAPFQVGAVVEVTFPSSVALPDETEFGDSPQGPWTIL